MTAETTIKELQRMKNNSLTGAEYTAIVNAIEYIQVTTDIRRLFFASLPDDVVGTYSDGYRAAMEMVSAVYQRHFK